MAIQLKPTKNSTPPRIVVHSSEGVGKSTFFSQLPDPAFIPTEKGLSGIDAFAIIDPEWGSDRVETWKQFTMALRWAKENQDQYKSLIIDTADWLELIMHKHIIDDYDVETLEQAAGGYGKGYGVALGYWQKVLRLLDGLNAKGKIIGIACHSTVRTLNDPLHDNYDRWELKLHQDKNGRGSSALIREWADIIGFAETEKFTSNRKSDSHKDSSKAEVKQKATETGKRILHLQGSASFIAKNRYSLPAKISFSWAELSKHMKGPAKKPAAAKVEKPAAKPATKAASKPSTKTASKPASKATTKKETTEEK